MTGILQIIIQLVSGAVGENVAGKAAPKLSLGTLGNSLAGILGGGLGAQLAGSPGHWRLNRRQYEH